MRPILVAALAAASFWFIFMVATQLNVRSTSRDAQACFKTFDGLRKELQFELNATEAEVGRLRQHLDTANDVMHANAATILDLQQRLTLALKQREDALAAQVAAEQDAAQAKAKTKKMKAAAEEMAKQFEEQKQQMAGQCKAGSTAASAAASTASSGVYWNVSTPGVPSMEIVPWIRNKPLQAEDTRCVCRSVSLSITLSTHTDTFCTAWPH